MLIKNGNLIKSVVLALKQKLLRAKYLLNNNWDRIIQNKQKSNVSLANICMRDVQKAHSLTHLTATDVYHISTESFVTDLL